MRRRARATAARASTSTASPMTQPNLRHSGHSAPAPSVRMRQKTRAPGAARAIFSTSSTQSTAKSVTPSCVRARDVALFLDGVAVGDAARACAGREHHLDLGNGGGVEGGAERGEEGQDFRRRIGLHRIEDAAVRHDAGEGFVVAADDVEVDHEAGALGSSLVQERADAVGHHRARSPFPSVAARESCAGRRPAMETGRNPWIPQPAKGRVVRAEQLLGNGRSPNL